MSSGSEREHPLGVIRQGAKIVGCVSLPEASDTFIREFNHCYGQLRLEVLEPLPAPSRSPNTNPHTFQLPTWFRHVWHATHPSAEANGNEPDENGSKHSA